MNALMLFCLHVIRTPTSLHHQKILRTVVIPVEEAGLAIVAYLQLLRQPLGPFYTCNSLLLHSIHSDRGHCPCSAGLRGGRA